MLKKTFALMASAALIVTSSACSTVTGPTPASDITPTRENSSWCQGDRIIRYAQADAAGQDDPGNQFTDEPTVEAIQAHNARLRAACPED